MPTFAEIGGSGSRLNGDRGRRRASAWNNPVASDSGGSHHGRTIAALL
jgi:hypothetical protein